MTGFELFTRSTFDTFCNRGARRSIVNPKVQFRSNCRSSPICAISQQLQVISYLCCAHVGETICGDHLRGRVLRPAVAVFCAPHPVQHLGPRSIPRSIHADVPRFNFVRPTHCVPPIHARRPQIRLQRLLVRVQPKVDRPDHVGEQVVPAALRIARRLHLTLRRTGAACSCA